MVNTVALAIFGGHCRLSEDSIKDPVFSSDSEDDDEDDDDDDCWTGSLTLLFTSLTLALAVENVAIQVVRTNRMMDFIFFVDTSSDDVEELDEDFMKELSEGLDDLVLAEKFSRSPLPDERNRRVTKPRKRTHTKEIAEFHLDEWIHLQMDKNAAHQIFALRQKWQVCSHYIALNMAI